MSEEKSDLITPQEAYAEWQTRIEHAKWVLHDFEEEHAAFFQLWENLSGLTTEKCPTKPCLGCNRIMWEDDEHWFCSACREEKYQDDYCDPDTGEFRVSLSEPVPYHTGTSVVPKERDFLRNESLDRLPPELYDEEPLDEEEDRAMAAMIFGE